MAINTNIQWADDTTNPTQGCDGCELWSSTRKSCYAGVETTTFGAVRPGYSPTFKQITFWPGRMEKTAKLPVLTGLRRNNKPWLDGFPRLIFVSDMSDALSAAVPFDWLRAKYPDLIPSGR